MELDVNTSITKVHNYIYANEGLNNFEVLEELLKVLYCKSYDELHDNLLEKAVDSEGVYEASCKLLSTLNEEYPSLFSKSDKFLLKKNTIIYVFDELSGLKISSMQSDIKGHLMQRIIDRSFREGRGQFFTPPQVVDFIVKMVNPKSGEIGCDPACGTGGFMFAALENMKTGSSISKKDVNNVYFYDISRGITRLIAMRLMFEFSINDPNICIQDSLSTSFDKSFDFVLTNPPFGTQGKIVDPELLGKYVLGRDEDGSVYSSQAPDILFVERVLNILKKNGRAAIVLPDGNFENPSADYLRKFLFEKAHIDAVVSLPDGTFIPYGTGVKSSVIFFTKDDQARLKNYPIFFGRITKLGYSFSKHSKPLLKEDGYLDEDYSDVIKAYQTKNYDDYNFLVDSAVIEKNLFNFSYNKYCKALAKTVEAIKKGLFSRIGDVVTPFSKRIKIDPDTEYRYVEIGDVSADNCEITNCSLLQGSELPSRASFILKENDVVVAIAGNSIGTESGAKAIVTKEYDGCLCTNGFLVLRNPKISPYLILHFFNSIDFRQQVLISKYGTAIPTINRDDFLDIVMPRYSKEKEDEIVLKYQQAFELKAEARKILKSI